MDILMASLVALFNKLMATYNPAWLLEIIMMPQRNGLSLIHIMIQLGLYQFVRDIAIEKLGYRVDYFHPFTRMTLIHTVARYRTDPWDEEELA